MKRLHNSRAGFTLVELLTVVILIGFLAGMVAGTAPAVMRSVKSSAIRSEIQQLSMALEAYKAEYGEYPPDGTDQTAVLNHIKRCYPDATNTNRYATVTPYNALFIFLGPHSANATSPFSSAPYSYSNGSLKSNNINTTKAFFEFDIARFGTEYQYGYLPSGCNKPYIYLKSRGATGKKYYSPSSYVAYKDSNGNWYNQETYQIISAGLDDEWGNTGTVTISGTASNFNKNTLDNVVNFGKKTIKDLFD